MTLWTDPDHPLSLADLDALVADQVREVALSDTAVQRIRASRQYLDRRIADSAHPVYGINTGFGYLYSRQIEQHDLESLQANLVQSHACGMGEEVPEGIVRLMLVLKARSLAYGHSGVQLETVSRLLDFHRHRIHPVVFQQGSLGASGDLAPLAHLTLPLLGLGEVRHEGRIRPAAEVLAEKGWEPLHLRAKEGLALLNGTQFMSSYAAWILCHARRLSLWADIIGLLSLEGFHGRKDPFDALLHQVRPHPGQVATAAFFRHFLQKSEIQQLPPRRVQDPYSFRCIPQVHGASKDALGYMAQVLLTELNAVTDNPTIFPEEDLILSGGNFHGQPLALTLDFAAIALAELGSISERRIYQLLYRSGDLPSALTPNAGLHSGLMILQYTAASIASQNKQLCTPASVDSIVSSNDQEDHVSMGANAATKGIQVLDNLERILAIELITAAQALHFRKPLRVHPTMERLLEDFRSVVPPVTQDRVFHHDMVAAVTFLRQYAQDPFFYV